MESQIDIIGKPFKRISAIVGKEMTKEEIKNVSTPFCSVFCTSSMIGIFMSHKKAWENVINNNDNNVFVKLLNKYNLSNIPGDMNSYTDINKDFFEGKKGTKNCN